VHGSILAGAGVVSIDQGAIRGSRWSNPATYTGRLDPIRKAFAKASGVKPALLRANSEGACPNENGAGVIYADLAMMVGIPTTCRECEGKRFPASVLDHHRGGCDIGAVLALSVTEAEEFWDAGEARTPAAHARHRPGRGRPGRRRHRAVASGGPPRPRAHIPSLRSALSGIIRGVRGWPVRDGWT